MNAVVLLAVTVNANGMPENISVIRGSGFGLDEAAIQALNTWRFLPGKRNGASVPVKVQAEISFRLLASKQQRHTTRLNFTLPSAAIRPELIQGKIPVEPAEDPPTKSRIALAVGADGIPAKCSVLDSTSPQWADTALQEIRNWRFHPATLNGAPVQVKGVLELDPILPRAVPRPVS